MAIRVLIANSIPAGAWDQLVRDGFELVQRNCTPEELGSVLRDFDAVVIRSATKIRRQQIDEAKGGRLKLIVRAGVGMDNVDVAYAEASGIACRNTPLSSANAVAELALALLLSCSRGVSVAGHTMRLQKWEKKFHSGGLELSGSTVGIVGYGHIGRKLGEKCQALGMHVLSVVHRSKPEGCECGTMQFVSMDELLRRSDYIVLAFPGGTGHPFINAETIAKMKDGVVLVNISRGSNVDESALLDALNSGKVRAAGLDVWADEKNPNWELAAHPCVSCTPHIGASTTAAQEGIGQELVDLLNTFPF